MQEKTSIFNNNDKQNKQKLPSRGKTDWLGLGRTQDLDDPTYGNEPTRNCKQGDFKGSK